MWTRWTVDIRAPVAWGFMHIWHMFVKATRRIGISEQFGVGMKSENTTITFEISYVSYVSYLFACFLCDLKHPLPKLRTAPWLSSWTPGVKAEFDWTHGVQGCRDSLSHSAPNSCRRPTRSPEKKKNSKWSTCDYWFLDVFGIEDWIRFYLQDEALKSFFSLLALWIHVFNQYQASPRGWGSGAVGGPAVSQWSELRGGLDLYGFVRTSRWFLDPWSW